MPSDWHEDALHHKYDPLPEEPRHRRKRRRKRAAHSDHKHVYEEVCVGFGFRRRDGEVRRIYRLATRCKVCGRVGGMGFGKGLDEPPEGTPLYEVPGDLYFGLKVLPTEGGGE